MVSTALVPLGSFNGVEIQARPSDQYIDVTAMCQANGKRWSKYNESVSAKRYRQALSSALQIPEDTLAIVPIGGPYDKRHTYAHRRIALHCAAWISPEFELWVYEKIETLLTVGRVELRPQAPLTALQALQQTVQLLTEHDARLSTVETVVEEVRQTQQAIVARQEQADLQMQTVERSEMIVPPMTTRDKLNHLVRSYCRATTADHSGVWRKLYVQLYYRFDFNAQYRAQISGKRPLDHVEEAGLMDQLFAIASEILVF